MPHAVGDRPQRQWVRGDARRSLIVAGCAAAALSLGLSPAVQAAPPPRAVVLQRPSQVAPQLARHAPALLALLTQADTVGDTTDDAELRLEELGLEELALEATAPGPTAPPPSGAEPGQENSAGEPPNPVSAATPGGQISAAEEASPGASLLRLWGGLTLLSAGVGIAATGVYVGVRSNKWRKIANDVNESQSTSKRAETKGNKLVDTANTMLRAGGVFAACGAGLIAWHFNRDESDSTTVTALQIHPTGVSFSLHW